MLNNSFINNLECLNYKVNTKGGLYYSSTYDHNLDFFAMASRYMSNESLHKLFINAYTEASFKATAILLFMLDIREGRGERRIFNLLFKDLCYLNYHLALKVLYLIPSLGRYDYLLSSYNTPLWKDTVLLIKNELLKDKQSTNPNLLSKWLPSVRTHNKNNALAITLAKDLGLSVKDYRHLLSTLRSKLSIVEANITKHEYEKIDYSFVPSQAMKCYNHLFSKYDGDRFNNYILDLKKNKTKVNSKVLAPYEIIKEYFKGTTKKDLLDSMWQGMNDFLDGNKSNALVLADTSGSMTSYNYLPMASALGLAIYIAERNKGVFHDCFINFSSHPSLQKLTGKSLSEKLRSINYDNWESITNIDEALKLILNATLKSDPKDAPTHLIIISDMEFDCTVEDKPNYEYWKEQYSKYNLTIPKVIFWCVSGNMRGVPITKHNNGTTIISGFSPAVFKGILDIENYSPVNAMNKIIEKYENLLN